MNLKRKFNPLEVSAPEKDIQKHPKKELLS
jgi:hypothetical protein